MKLVPAYLKFLQVKPLSNHYHTFLLIVSSLSILFESYVWFNFEFLSRECDYLVDVDYGTETKLEPRYNTRSGWTSIKSYPFLNSAKSKTIARAFNIPGYSRKNIRYGTYHLLKRSRCFTCSLMICSYTVIKLSYVVIFDLLFL